jgi:ribosomal protein L19
MSIVFVNNEDRVVTYEGAVLATRERNYYDDSDFYAVVWDEEKQVVKNVEYATTRFGGGGDARVDATPEVLEKAKAYFAPHIAKGAINADQIRYETQVRVFKKFHTGTQVKVTRTIKSRKQGVIPEGFTGVLVWQGAGYAYHDPPQYGVKNTETGQCVFVSGKDLVYAGPEPTDDDVRLPLTMNDYDRILADVKEQLKNARGYTLGQYQASLSPRGCVVM